MTDSEFARDGLIVGLLCVISGLYSFLSYNEFLGVASIGGLDDVNATVVDACFNGLSRFDIEGGDGNTSGVDDTHFGSVMEFRLHDYLLALSVDAQTAILLVSRIWLILTLQLRLLVGEDDAAYWLSNAAGCLTGSRHFRR